MALLPRHKCATGAVPDVPRPIGWCTATACQTSPAHDCVLVDARTNRPDARAQIINIIIRGHEYCNNSSHPNLGHRIRFWRSIPALRTITDLLHLHLVSCGDIKHPFIWTTSAAIASIISLSSSELPSILPGGHTFLVETAKDNAEDERAPGSMGVIRKKTAARGTEAGTKYHCDVCSVDVTSTVRRPYCVAKCGNCFVLFRPRILC